MKHPRAISVAWVVPVLLVAAQPCMACGSPDDDVSNPDGNGGNGPGPAGEGGGAGMGPNPVGGNGGSGPAPSGSAGAPAQVEHCSPNAGIALPLGPDCLFDTEPEDLGIEDDPKYLSVSSVQLEEPVVAGQAYAFSFEARQVRGTFGGYTLELWGATPHTFDGGSRCGVATELLGTVEVPAEGVYCIDLVATGNHDYLLEVIRAGSRAGGDGGLLADLNYCPMAACP